jgi:hypothetical protein
VQNNQVLYKLYQFCHSKAQYPSFVVVYNTIGGELYVLAKHHKMCKLANWSRPSNITFCSRAPDRATEEQAKQPNIHMRGDLSI